jgi:uracil-DNA glycosylase
MKQKKYNFTFCEKVIEIDISWKEIFVKLNCEIETIDGYLKNNKVEISSDVNDIFRIFEKSIDSINTIILGQDPYYQKGVPTGRAFEVSNYNSWLETTKNTSLTNIVKEIYREKNNVKKNIADVRKEIRNDKFKIFEPNLIFERLENNGVFLLNTSMTCEVDNANSHKILWQCFTKKIIEYIALYSKNKNWLLWGSEAKEFKLLIESSGNQNLIYEYVHPVKNDFVGSGGMSKIIDYCMKSE